ncbi:MAG: hypothetical protein EPO07_04310 [Verrucomicrobia bacterium]|nr:MAG: hypothetical protein EPO07_04310 [Verrucomicrobiota bacterium]
MDAMKSSENLWPGIGQVSVHVLRNESLANVDQEAKQVLRLIQDAVDLQDFFLHNGNSAQIGRDTRKKEPHEEVL